MLVKGYVNIYRSGLYHRAGKPGAYDRHPGDIYPTEAAAVADIRPRSHYIATCPVAWEEAAPLAVNAPESEPSFKRKADRPLYFGLNNPRVGVEP